MNVLVELWGARNTGIAMLVVSGLLLIAAVLVGWEAINRGMGILALEHAQAAALAEDRRGVIESGREAAGWLPREPAAGLIAIDLSNPAAGSDLERLLLRVPQRNRQAVSAMLALHRLHHGGTVNQELAAGDQAIVSHLTKLTSTGGVPGPLTLPDADPPQAPLLVYAAERRFQAAWASGDVVAIRATAGELRLLMPRHPDIAGVVFALQTLTPSVDDKALASAGGSLPRGAKRELVLLKLQTLAPARAEALTKLLGNGK